ncbi:TonB-dependent receptor [Urechidicola sp. KH5]
MKNLRIFVVLLLLPLCTFAQLLVSGTVTEKATDSPLPGVDVILKGTARGTSTDFDGNYSLNNVNTGDILVFSYLGYQPQEITVESSTTINVALEKGSEALDEVVVIGYGTTTARDATGSVASIKADEVNRGAAASAEQLLVGQVAGVQVTTGGGAPGTGSTIRIRNGASLNANNDPLIVIDGLPVSSGGVGGSRSPLDLLNPNDIESFSILKDASATAIYGSRASNGVIIITTKKGKSGELKVDYSGNFSVHETAEFIDALSANQFRDYVTANGTPSDIDLLTDKNTNWQDEIFDTAFGTEHNVSVSGGGNKLNARGSVSFTKLGGTLKTSDMERGTFSLNLGSKLLDDHLDIKLNLKAASINNQFADTGAIGNAIAFDPTKPVRDPSSPYGGYFEWLENNGNPIAVGAPKNPVAMLELRDNTSNVNRFIGNIQFDYKFHFLPELRANVNLAIDNSKGKGSNEIYDSALSNTIELAQLGEISEYTNEQENELMDIYLNYAKYIESIESKIDFTAGYSYQNFVYKGNSTTNIQDATRRLTTEYYNENNLQSFFGRLNYSFKDKYLLTVTYRRDGSSRFSEENRWGNFPSAAFAWKVIDEDFMADSAFSNLKLRLGWGVTGQQDIGSFYPSIPLYRLSTDTAQYQFGNMFYNTYRAEPFNTTLKWEETTTYNIGVDFGFFKGRLNGSLDGYLRETKDLLNFIPFPAGSSLSNADNANIGTMENIGIELALNGTAIQKEDMQLDLGFNISWQDFEITKLTTGDDPNYAGVETGGISGGVGNTVQIHSVGYQPRSFFVYEQVYDNNGNPLEDVYVDRNGDGEITPEDRYRFKSPNADVTLGFNTNFTYKNWDFNMYWRGSFGNYVYNNVYSNLGFQNQLLNAAFPLVISNGVENVLDTGFINGGTERYLSDYYVQNASFVKLDNIGVGYNFGEVFKGEANLRVSLTGQNLLIISDYDGIDPEVFSGIDYNIYPRPRIYTLGVNLNF